MKIFKQTPHLLHCQSTNVRLDSLCDSAGVFIMEIWKDVVGYEGLYQISSLGRVKSLSKKCGSGVGYMTKEKIYKLSKYSDGYLYVGFCKTVNNEKKQKKYKVHRLVANMFIPNTKKLPQVNHINGVKYDNRVENLEWCTPSQNGKHAYKIGLIKPKKGYENILSKSLAQIDLRGVLVASFGSTREAARETGFCQTHIAYCCRNNKKYKGFFWRYECN